MSKTGGNKKYFLKKSKEPLYCRIIKYAMLLLFAYAAVFWAAVTLLSLFNDTYKEFAQPMWVGVVMAMGIALVIAASALAIKRRYIVTFVLSACGSAAMLASANWFVKTARHELESRAVPNDLIGLDKRYMYRALPVLAAAALALVLAVIRAFELLKKRKAEKLKKQSAPVKSIID